MKKIFLLTALSICSCVFSFGQTLSITEAFNNFNCNTFDCINGYMSSHKFGYQQNETISSNELSHKFRSTKPFEISEDNSLNYNQVKVNIKNGSSITKITMNTYESNYYNSLIQELENLDFKIASTTSNGDWNITNYHSTTNPNFTIVVKVGPSSKKNISSYIIEITKI